MILLLFACRPDPEPAWEGLTVDLDPFAIHFGAGTVSGVALGFEPGYDDLVNHDPWAMFDPLRQSEVPFFTWGNATSASWEGDDLRLALDDGHVARVTRIDHPEGFALQITAEGDTPTPFVKVSLSTPDGEGLYGLGEQFEAVNLRGHQRALQFELAPELESLYNEAHVPVPFLVSSGGWAAGVPSDWPMAWDVAATEPNTVDIVLNQPEGMDLRLFTGEPDDMIAGWTRTAGLPTLPPTWAFAPFLWRNKVNGSADVREDLVGVRANDLAFGTYWVDNPWQTFYSSMQPDTAMFPDWDALVGEAHAAGFRMMAWNVPYVSDEDPRHAEWADSYVPLVVGFNDFGELMDLSDETAMGRWQGRVTAAKARGIEGWKLDYGEDVQLGLNATRWVTPFGDGQDERTMHHRYAAYFHRAYAEPYGQEDRFILGRGGAFGTAAITDCIWPGDLDSDLSHMGDPGVGDGLAVGGLPSAIHGGASLAVSGFPAYASDVGGYRNARPDNETMIRWTEYAALMPIMQVGGGGSDHNYWMAHDGWGADTLAAGQRYTQLHTRLFPFFQALAVRASADGTPPLLPLGLADAENDEEAFLLGHALLVAPVIVPGATTRTIAFPPGEWVDWWTGTAYSGTATVPAPLGQGPLYLASGAVIPLLRPSVRTLSPSPTVDSWADDPGALTVRFVPGTGAFTVVDGPSITADATSLHLGGPGIYSSMNVEIWTTATHVQVDGADTPATRDGPWLRADVTAGEVTWN